MLRPVVMFMASCAAVATLAVPANATFPGANGKLVVAISAGIGTANPDGTGLTRLTTGSDSLPAWSADGQHVAFIRYTPERGQELWIMSADGSNPRLVRALEPDAISSGPAWSPDGNEVAFSRWETGDIEIVDVRNGSSRSVRPPGSPDSMEGGDWSPDGREIVVVGLDRELRCDPPDDPNECEITDRYAGLFRVAVDGSATTQIPITGTLQSQGTEPSWSPTGTEIVFQRSLNGFISIVDAGGGTPREVAEGGSFPVWSPDGAKLAYSGATSATRGQIYTINADGTGRTMILQGAVTPDWQPIANRAPVCSGATAEPGVLRPANGKFRKIELSGASDPDGDAVAISVTGVTQDEPVGRARDAWRARSPAKVWLRAERRPQRDGRVYRIAFRAADDRGAACEGVVHVAVPRHRHRPAVDSAPPSYDSLSPSGT